MDYPPPKLVDAQHLATFLQATREGRGFVGSGGAEAAANHVGIDAATWLAVEDQRAWLTEEQIDLIVDKLGGEGTDEVRKWLRMFGGYDPE